MSQIKFSDKEIQNYANELIGSNLHIFNENQIS